MTVPLTVAYVQFDSVAIFPRSMRLPAFNVLRSRASHCFYIIRSAPEHSPGASSRGNYPRSSQGCYRRCRDEDDSPSQAAAVWGRAGRGTRMLTASTT